MAASELPSVACRLSTIGCITWHDPQKRTSLDSSITMSIPRPYAAAGRIRPATRTGGRHAATGDTTEKDGDGRQRNQDGQHADPIDGRLDGWRDEETSGRCS